ncbi:hypothetical protein [Sphaerospermopsis aphanizomenoides]|nr:hypothetical protein [Sphaerospermopsis aphanizomenoides]
MASATRHWRSLTYLADLRAIAPPPTTFDHTLFFHDFFSKT